MKASLIKAGTLILDPGSGQVVRVAAATALPGGKIELRYCPGIQGLLGHVCDESREMTVFREGDRRVKLPDSDAWASMSFRMLDDDSARK